jgi:hypothetical protein
VLRGELVEEALHGFVILRGVGVDFDDMSHNVMI